MMKEWLDGNPVNREDMLRHDKWLCMMYPRLKLLHELLSENGSFWMTLDDNEIHRARMVMDDIFGEQNHVATCIWHKMDSPKNTAMQFSEDHDYLLVYAKDAAPWTPNLLARTEEMTARYQNPDNDPRGPWLLSDLAARNKYSQGLYEIQTPSGRSISGPPTGSYWRVSKAKFDHLNAENRIWWGESGNNRPGIKRFLSEVKEGVVPQTLWAWKEVGSTRNAKQALSKVMGWHGNEENFVTPKPTGLLEKIIHLATNEDSIVLENLFEATYKDDLNSYEQNVACYLDGEKALRWWHRNVAQRQYALQGWRKNKVYPDFIFAMNRDDNKERIMILETKGDHLDNPDTKYKQKVLQACADAFKFESVTKQGDLELVIDENTTVCCDLIFEEKWKADISKLLDVCHD
jgi:hypothetical protein